MNSLAEYMAVAVVSCILMLCGMLVVLQKMLAADNRRRNAELLTKIKRTTLMLRLQAYERLLLFLERNSPETLVLRLQPKCSTNAELHAAIIAAVRKEFESILAQQLYISAAAWQQFVLTKNNIIRSINTLAMETAPENSSMQLAQRIISEYIRTPPPTELSIKMLKQEAAKLF